MELLVNTRDSFVISNWYSEFAAYMYVSMKNYVYIMQVLQR